MKLWMGLFLLVVGLVFGLSLPTLAPRYVDPYLPKVFQDTQATVKGVVVRKQREADRLLLTISTSRGAILATFKKHITEIDLLVDQHDDVTLGVRHYEPFVEDPPIKSVMKPDVDSPPQEHPAPEESEEEKSSLLGDTPL